MTSYSSKLSISQSAKNAIKIAMAFLPALSATIAINSAEARPAYANELGAACDFCHIGKMASKQFTNDGKDYCQYLKDQNVIPKTQCNRQNVDLYDDHGNFLQTYSHCVPFGPPAPC